MRVLSRRNFLAGSTALVPFLAAKKLKVVVTGGHPGDSEYGCGGTVAKYTDGGTKSRFCTSIEARRAVPVKLRKHAEPSASQKPKERAKF